MARQSEGGGASDFIGEEIEVESNRIAKEFAVDAARIRRMLEERKDRVWAVFDRSGTFRYFWPFWEAFEFLPPKEALAFLETEKWKKVMTRAAVTSILTHEKTMLCNLKDWEFLLEGFVSYLEGNREQFLKAGTPGAQLDRAHWLEPYVIRINAYEELALKKDLDPDDAARLEAGREKLVELKISIVKELLQAFRSQTAARLLKNCLGLFTQALTTDEVDFYFRLDRSYASVDEEARELVNEDPIPLAPGVGGLADLLVMLGLFEKELTIGTLAKTRDSLGNLVSKDYIKRPRLALGSYFQMVGRREQKILDTAIDLYCALYSLEPVFWSRYTDRVSKALENEFCEEVVFRIKRKLVDKFKLAVRDIWDLINMHSESPVVSQTLIDSQPSGNVFRKEGEYWTICYGKKIFRLKDMKGLGYIAYLLKNPRQKIHVWHLQAAVEGSPTGTTGGVHNKMSDEQLEEQNLRRVSSPAETEHGPHLDPRAWAEFKHQRDELLEKLKTQNFENPEQAVLMREELNSINAELSGRYREVSSSREQARVNITRCIKNALVRIAENNPGLGKHFLAIRTGYYCSYNPDPNNPVFWNF